MHNEPERMASGIVRSDRRVVITGIGVTAPGGGRTFPAPEAMAGVDEGFYREVVRAGYRGPYLKQLATDVAEGTIDLEGLHDPDLPDDEAAARLLTSLMLPQDQGMNRWYR